MQLPCCYHVHSRCAHRNDLETYIPCGMGKGTRLQPSLDSGLRVVDGRGIEGSNLSIDGEHTNCAILYWECGQALLAERKCGLPIFLKALQKGTSSNHLPEQIFLFLTRLGDKHQG